MELRIIHIYASNIRNEIFRNELVKLIFQNYGVSHLHSSLILFVYIITDVNSQMFVIGEKIIMIYYNTLLK